MTNNKNRQNTLYYILLLVKWNCNLSVLHETRCALCTVIAANLSEPVFMCKLFSFIVFCLSLRFSLISLLQIRDEMNDFYAFELHSHLIDSIQNNYCELKINWLLTTGVL